MEVAVSGNSFMDFYLSALWATEGEGLDDLSCTDLKQKSLAALNSYRIPAAIEATVNWESRLVGLGAQDMSLIKTCADCHDGLVGPAIPFANTAAMGNYLLKSPAFLSRIEERIYHRNPQVEGPMPPGGALTLAQKNRLMEYFRGLGTRAQ